MQWNETFTADGELSFEQAKDYVQCIVDSFNDSHRPNEEPRELVSITSVFPV